MRKTIILTLFLFITAYGEIYANDAYFEDCKSYWFNILLSKTPDVITKFQNISSTNDYENLKTQGLSTGDTYALNQYNERCLKDTVVFKSSDKISAIYGNFLSIYQTLLEDMINFLPESYPVKNVKYSIYNMDINIISNSSKLDITIYIQNSKAVSRILVEKVGKDIIVKNIDIHNLFIHLHNVYVLQTENKQKDRENKKCNYNGQILNYSSPIEAYSTLKDIKWYCYPIYIDTKLLYNNKIITPKIPYIKDILFDKIAIIKNTTINEVYNTIRKNNEFGVYTELFPDNIIKAEFKKHYYFDTNTKNIEEFSKKPDNDSPSQPKEYIILSYYRTNNILKLTLQSSSSYGEAEETTMINYLLEQIGQDVKVIQFQLF